MIDLNALRVFERVASLQSFSAAARSLGSPKSSVSRSVAQLEAELGTRLLQRTTRAVVLTESGTALLDRCSELLARVAETVDYVGTFGGSPRGLLRVSAGIGFGINVLSELLPQFIARYPDVSVSLDMTSRPVDLIATSIDVAIARKGIPRTIAELRDHDTVELPGIAGRPRRWSFSKRNGDSKIVELAPRITVNDALTIHRMVLNGAGVGGLSAYVCAADVEAGRLVRLFPDWKMPSVEVNVVFPSNRELSPSVRAFVEFVKSASKPGMWWQSDPLDK
jgi:LysR family transcriptional regulator for bpeEF and oprC